MANRKIPPAEQLLTIANVQAAAEEVKEAETDPLDHYEPLQNHLQARAQDLAVAAEHMLTTHLAPVLAEQFDGDPALKFLFQLFIRDVVTRCGTHAYVMSIEAALAMRSAWNNELPHAA